MAYTDIDKSDDYFNTLIYAGNGTSGRSVTGVGFQPDWAWIKNRNDGDPHKLFDAVRGVGKSLKSNSTDAEASNEENGYLSAFNSDGFTLTAGSSSIQDVNNNGENYVSWNWLGANGTVTNTAGGINSTVSANTTAGFSIVTYTGNGSGLADNVGHGLGVAPKLMIGKNRTSAGRWMVGGLGVDPSFNFANDYIVLNEGGGKSTDAGGTVWNAAPTSTLVKFSNFFNAGSNNYVMYCFAEKKGFSKFGTYNGNGNSNGAFVYTGFKPAVWIVKRTNATNNWITFDNRRSTSQGFNRNNVLLLPNLSQGENTNDGVVDFVSNGIKIRDTKDEFNNSSGTYMYMAFAENPFVTSTGIPTPAR